VIVDVVKTVVVDGMVRRGVVVTEAGREVVEAMVGAGVDVDGLLPPSPPPIPPPRVTPRSTSSVAEAPRLMPDEPALRARLRPASAETDAPRVTEAPALTIGLPDGPRKMPPLAPAPALIVAVAPTQPLRILPPFEQAVAGMPPDVDKVTIPDGSEADNDGMRVVAESVEGNVTLGKSDDSTDDTPSPMPSAA
jgi:hypothetical protein